MTKESGYPKAARGGEDGFSKHGRGGEVASGGRDGRSVAKDAPARLPEAHGFGHKGGKIKGVLRYSGVKGAHRVGCK